MPKLTIDGVGTFNVDDSFTKLSPQDQHDAVDEMVASVRGSGGDTPAAATPPAASHSLAGAAVNSLVNGLPEAVHSGEAAAANYLKGTSVGNFLDSLPGYSMAQSAAAASAASNRNAADSARAYSRPATIPSSIADAVTGANGVVDGAARLGKALAYGVAENAAPVGADLALSAIPGTDAAGIPMLLARAGLGVTDGLQALGGVRDAKMKAGLSGDTTSTGDIGNAALQLALMRAGPQGNSFGGLAGKALRTAEGTGLSAIKGAAAPVMSDVGADLQGGQTSAGQVLSDGLEGAAAGAGLHAIGTAGSMAAKGAGSVMGAVADARHLSKLGGTATLDELTSNQAQAKAYGDAMDQAKSSLAAKYPGASDGDLTTMAGQQVDQAGVQKPDDLSDNAQRLQDDINTLGIYQSRQQASAGSASQQPGQVMKGALSDIKADLSATAAQWKRSGQITADDHSTLTTAIAEATAHNRALGTGGDPHGLTPYQRIGQIDGLTDDQQNQVQSLLRVADTLSQAGLSKNHTGALASLGQGIGANVGHIVASPLHFIPVVGHAAAGTVGHAVGGIGKQLGAGLDSMMGVGLPDILARQGAIQSAAAKAGISPTVTGQDLQSLRDGATAGVQAIASAKVAAAQQRAQAAAKAAGVTSAVTDAYGPGDPGWMASIAKDNGITGDSIRRFLAAGVADGRLTQDQADHLTGTDNIGPAIGPLATAIRNQVQSGQWDQQHQQTPAATPPVAASGPATPPSAPMPPPGPQPAPAAPQPPPIVPPGPASAPMVSQRPPVLPPQPATAPQPQSASGPVLNVPPPVMPPQAASRTPAGGAQVPVVPPLAKGSGMAAQPSTMTGPLPADVLASLRAGIGSTRSTAASATATIPAVVPATAPSGVRNPITYQAIVAKDAATAQSITTRRPDLADIVATMAQGRSTDARRATMERGLAAMFGHDVAGKAAARAVLEPLANYGKGRSG